MGFVHSARAIDLLVALWHNHTPEEDGHGGLTLTGPPCHVCKPLHVLLGWSSEEYNSWVEHSVQPVRKENTIGTRGIVGVIVGGQAKVAYNHFDSYPEALGVTTLLDLRMQHIADGGGKHTWAAVRDQAQTVRMIQDEGPDKGERPTDADKAALADYLDTRVSGGSSDDWYCLTRNLQGKLLEMLKVGYMVDAGEFPHDSLFCEWGYVLNLDEGTFEVYRGFQKAPHSDGHWAHLGRYPREHGDYYPIRRVATWHLHELPTQEEFLAAFRTDDDD